MHYLNLTSTERLLRMIFLNDKLWFPDVCHADEEGLLAVGENLCPERLILAYNNGIFPWFIEHGLVFWFCPAERFVIYPNEIHISHSMQQIIRKGNFTVTENENFEQVINSCSKLHESQSGSTWISQQFIESYTKLHEMGFARSIEVWEGEDLAGGLYGVEVGNIFCGESMFSKKSNASKLALIHLCKSDRYQLIDCQVYTQHLETLGARLISRDLFLQILKTSLPVGNIKNKD